MQFSKRLGSRQGEPPRPETTQWTVSLRILARFATRTSVQGNGRWRRIRPVPSMPRITPRTPAVRRGRPATAAVLLCLSALALAGPLAGPARAGVPASTALPATFAGLTSEETYVAPPPEQRALLTAQRRAGVRLLRQTFPWGDVEPRPGTFNWRTTDAFVLAAARAGIEVMPILFGTPAWGDRRPPYDERHGTYPPKSNAAFSAYARAVAQRYGRGGELWRAHRDVAARPVRNYQVWNEPNLSIYWLPRVDARAYARLVAVTRTAIRLVDPGARIVLAGMPTASHLGSRLTTYLDQLYDAGARGTFDVVAVNAYATSSRTLLASLRDVRRAVDRRRDPTAGLWMTEFGWSAGGPKGTYNAGTRGQAALLSSTIAAISRERRALRLQGFVYYGWTDLPPYAGRSDFWGLHTGLYWKSGEAKPAAKAYATAVAALR